MSTEPKYEDIIRIKEMGDFIESKATQNLIVIPHVEGIIQYFYVIANESKEKNHSLKEYINIINEETKKFKRFIDLAKGEVGDADKGIYTGILFIEKLISESKDFKNFFYKLDKYVNAYQKGRMMYHKMKLMHPDSRLETFAKKLIDGLG
jgi:hypothetical protein